MKYLVIPAIVLAALLAGCEKDEPLVADGDSNPGEVQTCTDSSSREDRIIGCWLLLSTYDPWQNQTYYPSVDSATETLVFKVDSAVRYFDSRGHDYNWTYEFRRFDNQPGNQGPDSEYYLWIENAQNWFTLTCDTLVIDNTPVDGSRKVYAKEQ